MKITGITFAVITGLAFALAPAAPAPEPIAVHVSPADVDAVKNVLAAVAASPVREAKALDVYIIDNSYSTSYTRNPAEADAPEIKTHLDKAKQAVKKWLAEGNTSMIITTGKPAAVISKPESKPEVSIAAVDRIEQSWNSADLKPAMGLALEEAAKDKSNLYNKRLFIVIHSTRSKWDISNSGLKQLGPQLASLFTQITVVDLADGQKPQWNGAILNLQPTSHLVSTKWPVDFLAYVRGYFSTGLEPRHDTTVRWTVDGQPRANRAYQLSASATPLPQTLSDFLFDRDGFHLLTAHLDDPSDHLSVDNVRHRVIEVASQLKVLVVEGTSGGEKFGGAAFYFKTVFEAKSSPYALERIKPSELREKALGDFRALALVNVPEISAEQADALAAFVHDGGALLIFMGGAVKQDQYNSLLFERHALLPGKLLNTLNYHRRVFKLAFANGVTGGDFRLSFNGVTSRPIRYSADADKTAADIQAVVGAVAAMPATTVVPDGDNLHYTLTFTVNGGGDALPPEQAAVNGSGLQGNKTVAIGTGILSGSKFDFKPNSALHPLITIFANHENTGLDQVETDKYWRVDPDLLINTVKELRDTQNHMNDEFAGVASGSKPLTPQLILDQTKLANQLKDLLVSYRELSDSPAEVRDPLGRVPAAVMRLLKAASPQKPFSREDQEGVKILLNGICHRLEATRPERVMNYLPMKASQPIDPAITAQTVGHGRVIFISTSANTEWTDFPNHPSYPPLIYELLDGSLRSRDGWMNLTVGDRLAIPSHVLGHFFTLVRSGDAQKTIEVFPPQRDVEKIPAVSPGGTSQNEEWRTLYHTDILTQPGTYTLTFGDRTLPIVVNVPAQLEADVTTVDNAAISKALGGVRIGDHVSIKIPVPKEVAAHRASLTALAGKISDEPLRKQLLGILPEIKSAAAHSVRVNAIAADLKSVGGVAEVTPGGPTWLRAVAGDDAMHLFDQLISVDINDKQSPHNKDYHLLTNVTDEWLAQFEGMTELKNLSIANTNIKGPGLKYLAGLTQLESLNMTLCPTTDEYLQPLANLTELKRFGLASAQCNGTGFKYLGKMTKLENLNFHYTPVNDDGLREICRMTSLERLEIVHCHWTDSGAVNFVHLKNMQRLQLGSRQATGASVAFLKDLPKLKELDLHDLLDAPLALRNAAELQTLTVLRVYLGPLKDDDYKNIARLTNLEELVLGGGTITDAAALDLAGLKKLKKLTLGGTKITPAALEKLKSALPGLTVTP